MYRVLNTTFLNFKCILLAAIVNIEISILVVFKLLEKLQYHFHIISILHDKNVHEIQRNGNSIFVYFLFMIS